MTRLVAVAILPLALLLPGFAHAEEWTQGTLTLTWDIRPPDNVDWGVPFDASASACYDPNLPEGTEWYWMNPSFTFEWSFPPEASYNWISNYDHTSATVSFCELDDPCGEKDISVTVDFGGQIHVDDGNGGQTLDVVEPPATIELQQVVRPVVNIVSVEATGWSYPTYLHCRVVARGNGAPLNGALSVLADWSRDARAHLTLNPPPTSFTPVAYNPNWSQVFGPYHSHDGTPTVGFNGNIEATLVVNTVPSLTKYKHYMVFEGQPPQQ